MAANETPQKLPSTENPSARRPDWARCIRRILAATACLWLIGFFVFSLMLLWLTGPANGLTAVASLLRLPLYCVVPFVVANALASADICVELLRIGTHRSRRWSDKRHDICVLVFWIVFLSGQLPVALLARQRFVGG